MKYIKTFKKKSDAINDLELVAPLDGYCIENDQVILSGDIETNKELEIVEVEEDVLIARIRADYLTFTCIEDGGISMSHYGTNQTTTKPNISYSLNKGEWITWDGTNIPLTAGDKLQLKGINSNGISRDWNNRSQFVIKTGKIEAGGNIMSLIDGLRNGTKIIPCDYCFLSLFEECTSLTTAPELPAIELKESCYNCMFSGCSSLVTAPELPATDLTEDCYNYMFYGCTSLISTPKLPSTNLAICCYQSMFSDCENLINAPVLPATILANSCYSNMFSDCSSLVNAPQLPATTLAENCYEYMFAYCNNLVNAPELPATTLAECCYSGMFEDCTSLVNAPDLPATNLAPYCYSWMFHECTNLGYLECMAINPSTEYTDNWLEGANTNGTFKRNIKTPISSWTLDESGILPNWNIITDKPEDNQIYYISIDDNIVTGWNNATELTVLSNTYENGLGIVTFNEEVNLLKGNDGESEESTGSYLSKNIKTCVIPDSITILGAGTFRRLENFEEFDTNNVTYLGTNLFRKTNLQTAIVRKVTDVDDEGGWQFNDLETDLTVIVTNDSETIPDYLIDDCYDANLKVIIQNNIKTIGQSSISSCYNMESLTIPASITLIKEYALSFSSISELNYLGTKAQWNLVTKENGWCRDINTNKIHCTDGDVNI